MLIIVDNDVILKMKCLTAKTFDSSSNPCPVSIERFSVQFALVIIYTSRI